MIERYERWEDVLSTQMRILSWYGTTDGVNYLSRFFENMNGKHTPEERLNVQRLVSIQARTLIEAEPVFVSRDVTELIDHARETFDPEPTRPNDPFTFAAFVLLPRPLMLPDAPITVNAPMRSPLGLIPIRAIAWVPIHNEDMTVGSFWVSYYADYRDELTMGDDRWDEDVERRAIERGFPAITLVHQFQWEWGTNPWTEPEKLNVWDGDTIEETVVRGRAQAQLVQTLWRIGQQIVPSRERPARQQRRDAARRGLRRANNVTVIRLRRTSGATRDDDSGRRLTVRHIVRGYWARRHFKDGQTRQVWVRSHVRGDESLPFRETTRAWEFTR